MMQQIGSYQKVHVNRVALQSRAKEVTAKVKKRKKFVEDFIHAIGKAVGEKPTQVPS